VSRNRYFVRILQSLLLILAVGGPGLYAQIPEALQNGISSYQKGSYTDALRSFRRVITDSAYETYQGDGYFWVGKTYIAMNEYDEAARNLEYFLATFDESRLRSEGLYQKGRLLYLQRDYEQAIQVLYGFINQYSDDPYLANAYFWIAESLYSLGHFEEAEKVYTYVADKFPASFKVEAARYRLQLIQFKYRENEIVKLLKISHEEYLEAVDEFLQREKAYEQALSEYQRRLAVVMDEDIQSELDKLNATVKEQQVTIAGLEEQNRQLRASIGDSAPETPVAERESRIAPTDTDKVRELLEMKAEALELKEFYLGLIEKGGAGQ
jgi:TolA-binding protein